LQPPLPSLPTRRSSDLLIDPAGSTGGYVPSTSDNLRCADAVGKNLMLLVRGVTGCHLRLARASFNNQPVAEHRVLTGERAQGLRDRKSTRLNSSHVSIS